MSENSSVHKLPLEVMGLILLNLGNPYERRFEEIKKCRLISPRWYKAVQDIFQDHFFHHGLTHFDGSKYNYGKSRRFGLNIFGSFPLNFATFKISNSELYLMKNNILAWLISTNLQNLILQDNQLNMKDLLEVLKMFPNIVKLEFIQSSKDMNVAETICQQYANTDEKSDIETIEMIKKELAGTDNFLRNLKKIDFKIIHASVLNFVILIISCSQCDLEGISIDFNICAIISFLTRSDEDHEVNYKKLEIRAIAKLNKFSKSLKTIKITAMSALLLKQYYLGRRQARVVDAGISRLYQSIFNVFNEDQLRDIKSIEELQINLWRGQFYQSGTGLLDFIKSQDKCPKVHVGVISNSLGPNSGLSREDRLKLKKAFFESLSSSGVQFGYKASRYGFDPIVQSFANLTNVEVDIGLNSAWKFSDHQVIYLNCESLILNYVCPWHHVGPHWRNFYIPDMVINFPNLKNLKIEDRLERWDGTSRTQVRNEDLQTIIMNLPNLEKLSLLSLRNLDDSGLTGLTHEALEARMDSPNLPLRPGERTGMPISHLKNLVELTISRDTKEDYHHGPYDITDKTPIYGFEYEVPKFKSLHFCNSNITAYGIGLLKRKLTSSCRLIVDEF